jgi:hypothetical protein
VVLELVPEERARDVDLLTSDNGNFLTGQELLVVKVVGIER